MLHSAQKSRGLRPLVRMCRDGHGQSAFAAANTGVAGLTWFSRVGSRAITCICSKSNPGAAKTTVVLQFLIAGRKIGERGIYRSLAERSRSCAREPIARLGALSARGIRVPIPQRPQGLRFAAGGRQHHPNPHNLNVSCWPDGFGRKISAPPGWSPPNCEEFH
jgi:hypothetical protein